MSSRVPRGAARPRPGPDARRARRPRSRTRVCPTHEPRPPTSTPTLERRAERQVAAMFILAALLIIAVHRLVLRLRPGPGGETVGIGVPPTSSSACTLGLALLLIGIGLIQWARKLMSDHEIVEYRHGAALPPRTRKRRSRRSTRASTSPASPAASSSATACWRSLALLGIPTIVMLRDLGPLPGDACLHRLEEGHARRPRRHREARSSPATWRSARSSTPSRRSSSSTRTRTATSSLDSRASSCRTPRPRPP